MERFPGTITTGDLLHVYGKVGYDDNTVRRRIKMDAPVDEACLRRAVDQTARRYPYLCVRLRLNAQGFYYAENPAPVAILHTSDQITLSAPETNYHVWAVCYSGDELFLDFFHGLADGIGLGALTETLLYYYIQARYGDVDRTGIRTLEDPIRPEEYADPMDSLPDVELPKTMPSAGEPPYDLFRDAGMTRGEARFTDVIVPESAFLRFTSASDASPGIMVSLLAAKAIDTLDPERKQPIVGRYVMNARPALHAPEGHHNCLSSIQLSYSDRLKALPFETQCTCYRGMTFLQSDAERILPQMVGMASAVRMIAKIPDFSARRDAFYQTLHNPLSAATYVVSYTGQWKRPALEPHVLEMWTHANSSSFLVEIKAISGNLFLSFHRNMQEDCYVSAFLRQLEQYDIPYTVAKTGKIDIAAFPMPEQD